jgi:hypothetical protein
VSTILKALRRLEEEKTRDGAPRPLREEVASGPGERSGRRWTLLIPVLALAVGAGIGASAWWLWPSELERAVDTASAPSVAVTPEPLQPVAAPPVEIPPVEELPPPIEDANAAALQEALAAAAPEMPGIPDDAFASDVEVVDRPVPTPRIEPPPPPPVEIAVAEPEPPAPAPRVEPPTPTRVAREIPPEPDPVPERREPERAASVAPPAAPVPAPAADVYVTRTQWHPEHTRRSAQVQVAGQDRSVKEGDVVGDYLVDEIKPTGVILSRDGETIEQKIGKPPKAGLD